MKPEEKYRQRIDKYLTKYFNLDLEVWSECGTKRIDYILQSKESGHVFGLEVKKNEHLTGTKLGQYLIQASNYANLKFKTKFLPNPERVLIFISPALSMTLREIKAESKIIVDGKEYYELYHKLDHKTNNTNSFLGCFNVGEIRSHNARQSIYSYFYFHFKNQVVWDSLNGIRLHNYKVAYEIMLNNRKPV